jgi:fluoride exporter
LTPRGPETPQAPPPNDADDATEPELPLPLRTSLAPSILVPIAIGGVAGTLARAGVVQLWPARPQQFPLATFVVNITGAALLGFILAMLFERWPGARSARLLLATGFCGAYTTFSTFMVDADLLIKSGDAWLAAVYVLASLVTGVLAMAAGLRGGTAVGLRLARGIPVASEVLE